MNLCTRNFKNTYGVNEDVYNKFIKDNSGALEKYYDLSFDELWNTRKKSKMVNDAFAKYVEVKHF